MRRHKKGKAEGRAEGETGERIRIAKDMLAAGMDIETIGKLTKLSGEEIGRIKSGRFDRI